MKGNGFTLMELMVVVTIVGIIAGFAIPNYAKSVERAHRKDAENNLMIIHAAQQLYAANNASAYWAGGNLAAINLNLGLNIIANGMTYTCAGGGAAFNCTAVRVGGWAFTVTVNQGAIVPGGGNPSCGGTCP